MELKFWVITLAELKKINLVLQIMRNYILLYFIGYFSVGHQGKSGLGHLIVEISSLHTIRNTHTDRTLLNPWSALQRNHYKHNTQEKTQTTLPAAGFESATSTSQPTYWTARQPELFFRARSHSCEKRPLPSSCYSAFRLFSPFVCNISAPAERIFMKFECFSETRIECSIVIKIWLE